MLLENGADINAQGGHYDNALQAVVHVGRLEVVHELLQHGADVNVRCFDGSPLKVARSAERRGKPYYQDIVRLLEDYGARNGY